MQIRRNYIKAQNMLRVVINRHTNSQLFLQTLCAVKSLSSMKYFNTMPRKDACKYICMSYMQGFLSKRNHRLSYTHQIVVIVFLVT